LGEDEIKPQHNPAELKTGAGGLPVLDHRIFLGKLDPATLSFGERLVVKMVKAPSGDFREWEKVREWGREIAGNLGAGLVEA
jgi:menaquinone-dependent protoporphyrinogen oxidase